MRLLSAIITRLTTVLERRIIALLRDVGRVLRDDRNGADCLTRLIRVLDRVELLSIRDLVEAPD